MVIDKGKLIALLVDKTDRSKKDIEDQLTQLVSRIQETTQSGRQFHIEGFGTFGMDEGVMYFDPSGQLKTEINQKYAGMKPIELMAAFKESGAGVPVEEIENEPKPVVSAHTEATPDDELPVVEDEPEEQQPAAEEEIVAEAEDQLGEMSESAAKEESLKEKPATKPKFVADTGDDNRMGPMEKTLMVAVILIVLLVGGWLLYDSGVLNMVGSGESNAIPADTTEQKMNQPALVSSDTSAARTDSTAQNPGELTSGTAASAYGLKGAVNKQAEDVYTIVIHSFRLRSTVEEIADDLDQQGYRTVLFEGEPNGSTRWRLGLGQFESETSAQQAVDKLPEKYQENHFITRIN